MLLLWLLVGAFFGNLCTLAFVAALGTEDGSEYAMLVSYPMMFIPPMIYASFQSRKNSYSESGVKLDSSHFSPLGGLLCAVLVALSTIFLNYSSDPISSAMPDMPDWLKKMMTGMTNGVIWVDFICVSIFAPICEEWLCRGMVLRGLLHRKVSPAWAIVFSALFFALIHANPWQAIPAFLMGCLFGYVYYKTGSLKLTMLMHFTNNTFALVMANIDSLKDVENWSDLFKGSTYWLIFAACLAALALIVFALTKIKVTSPEGSSDVVPSIYSSSE
jgi:membrane protease YdiL (CAAX protease family)